jgi:hypothetical protein
MTQLVTVLYLALTPRWPALTRPGCGWPTACTGCTATVPTNTSLLICHPKRGKQGIEDAGVLGRLRGVAVRDAWAP